MNVEAPSQMPAVSEKPFATVEVFDDPARALDAWRALAPQHYASFYQSEKFLLDWLACYAAAEKVSPFFIVARDGAGAATALLPFGLFRLGPLRIAQFLGGKESNYNLGLFRDPEAFSADDLRLLLKSAARQSPGGPHLYRLKNLPPRWNGWANPLLRLPNAPAASPAYATQLGPDGEAWLKTRLSADTRKKLRKKEKRLTDMGTLTWFRADGAEDVDQILDAFFAQKRQRFSGFSEEEGASSRRFYAALCVGQGAAELHALRLGDRIVATFCAGLNGGRMQGMFNSFDADPEIARSSPGDILLTKVLADACARGIAAIDLGVGAARYKKMFCDDVEAMADVLFAPGLIGRLVQPAFALAQAAKRAIKHNPRLWAGISGLRRREAKLRAEQGGHEG